MLNLTNNLYDNQQKQNELKQVDTKKNLSLVASDVLDSTRQQVKQYTGTDNYSVKELSLIAGAMSASNDKKRTAVKVSTALDISKAEGVDFDTAYNNLDAYAKMYADETGEWTPAFGEKVKGYVKQGSLSGKLIDLQQQWHDIDLADGDLTEIESQIEAVQNEMATISKYTPNNIVEKFLQLAGNNWQYMTKIGLESASAGMAATMLASVMASAAGVGKGVAVGAAGGPLGMAIGGTAGLLSSGIALATIYGAGATAQGVKATYDWSKPGMYYELRKRGVSKETAEYVATGSGLTEGVIETLFEGTIFANYLGKMTATKNIAGAMGDTVNNGALKNITNRIAAALHLSGASEAWLYAGMKLASDFTIEGAQETFEGLSNDGFKAIALSLEGIPAKKEDFETVKERYDEFIGGGLLSLGLGLPFAYGTKFKFQNKIDTDASTLSAWQYVKSLKDEAQQNPSKQWFIERHEEDTFIDQDLSRTEKREMLAQVYDKNHKTIEEQQTTRAELETIDTADNLNENFEAGNIDEEGNQIEAEASPILPEPKRMEDGRLRTQTSDQVRQNADGTETHIFKIGTADSGKRYGYIEYTIDDNNKAINIDRVAMAKGQESLTKESILELEQQWEGWDFNWNPTSEAQMKVKNELLTDPLNENQGKLNWYNAKTDVDANIQLARELNKAFPNITKEESLVGVRLMEFSAQAEGLTTKEWLNRRVQQFAVSNDPESRGFINLDKNTLEAVVYVGEHGNFSTLAHEVFHAGIVQTKYSKQLKDALQEAAETPEFKAYLDSHQRLTHMETEKALEAIKTMSDNVKEWNEAQDEITATLFESYLRDGKTFSDKLKAIFRKIADLFRSIYKGLKASGALNDNIIKAYDAILTENPEFAKMVEQDTTQNNSVTLKQSLDYDSIEQELKANPKNFDKDGNHLAPNGKKSNLTYEQWVTVRTPQFKNWFGDWENDPQNASKMIDKNGEPLVCYHGSKNSFDTFEKNMIGSSNDIGFFGEGFYFTFQNWEENGKAAKLEASFYGSNVYDVFLNIRNPFDFSTLYDFSLDTENQDNMYAFLYNIAKKYPELSSQISMPSTETPIDEFGYEYELNELSPKEYIEKIDNLLKNPPLKEVTYNKETKPVYGYWNIEKNQSAGYTYDTKEELHASYSNTLLNTLNLNLPAYTSHELIMGTNFSEVIKKQGYDGIIQSKTGDEVIAFESNQIKSATDNNGDFNPNNPSIRYQKLDDYMYEYTFADARRKDTLEEFLDYELSLNGQEIFDDIKDELVEMWKEAHGVSDKPVPTLADISASEDSKDETMKAFVSTDEGVINFMKRWQDAYKMRNHAAYGGIDVYYDAEERRYVDQVSQAVDNFSSDASQFMKAIAMSKKELTPETIKKVRTTINNEPRLYRDLFAQLTGDKNLQVKYFTDTVQDINDPRFIGLNITEKRKLVNRLKGEQIRADIMSGKEKIEGNVELAINSYEADIKDLNTKLAATQKELNYTTYDLNKQQKANLNMLNEQRILNRQIANLERTIRNKLDNGHKIDESLAKELNDKNDRLSLINEEVKAIREQDKEKAAAKLQEKLDNLKKEIRQKELEKAALQEVHQYKKDLHTSILAPISSNVDHEYAKKIKGIQAIVAGASGYQNDNITYNGKKYTLDDFRAKVDSGEIKVEGLSDYQLKRYLNTSLADLTVGDLERLKDTRDYYENRGRQMWQAKVDDRNYRLKQQRAELYNTILENSRFDKTKNVAGSEEDRERRNSALNKLRLIFYKTLNMDSKAQVIGNDSENSLAYKLMVTDYYKHEDNKALNLAKREDPLFALKDELGIKNKDLYDPIEIDLSTKFGDKIQSFTPSQLAYIYYSQFNEQNKAAVSYGVLASDEKTDIVRAYNGKETLANQELQALGDARYERALQQATEYFNEHPEIKQFIDAIFVELQTRGDALNQLMIDMWNQEIELVGSYLPMFRKSEDNTEVEGQVLNNLMNGPAVGKVQTSPNRGMTKSRIDMSPLHQTPVNMDYIGIAFRAIEQQEHLLEYAEYIRDMNALFKGRGSRDIRLGIENIGGQGLLQDIDNFLNETANPYYTNDVQGINPVINTFRGNLYAGYLGLKISGMVLQMITSPTAFLQYVTPLELAGGLLKMTAQPKKTMDIINENSVFMKNRSIDPTIEMLKKAAQQKDTLQANLIEKETFLLEVADSWSVYGGWSAVFDKKLKELGEDTDANIKAAAEYADYVVRKTQPDADQARIAPLFKSGNAATKALLQFQTSLNVIWNQVAYNVDKTFNTFKNPNATKELKKQVFKDTMGVMVTYALAGAILAAVQRKGDDDDDWTDVVKELAYGATTQFTSAVPILGNYIDRINRIAITGEKGYNFQSTMFPVLDKITSGIESGIEVGADLIKGETQKDFDKKLKRALWNIGEGAALFNGLPVSAFKELGYTITEDGFKESLINNDFDFTFNPGALLGKRDY